MPSYSVTVATGSQWFAGTDDYVYFSLVGSAGSSERHLLDKAFYNDFERGAVSLRGGGASRFIATPAELAAAGRLASLDNSGIGFTSSSSKSWALG